MIFAPENSARVCVCVSQQRKDNTFSFAVVGTVNK